MAKRWGLYWPKILKQGVLFVQRLKIFFKSLLIDASINTDIFPNMFSVLSTRLYINGKKLDN